MILYDWKKIFDKSKGSAKECYIIVKMLTYKEVPRNKKDPIYKYYDMDFSGVSFLVHPEFLVYNAYQHTYRDIGVYLALASLRSYADYKLTGDTTLDVLQSPVPPSTLITERGLLRIEDTRIHFIYEEVNKSKEKLN